MKKLRLIQCGVGGFGHSWLHEASNKSPDFELVGLVDIVKDNLAKAGGDIGLPVERQFSTLEAALKDITADAVLSVTPPPVHLQHARVAFGHGLHVMTEKPFADTIENALEMLRLAKESKRQLVISQNYRYRPVIARTKQLLVDKVVGNFGHGHIDFYIPADFTGTFREKMEYPLLIDMAIHHLDLVRYVTGQNIVKITTLSFRPSWSWYRHDAALKMLLELEDGSVFSYSGDWSAKGCTTSWNGSWRLQCAEGSIHLESDEIEVIRCDRWGGDRWEKNITTEKIDSPPLEFTERAATLHRFSKLIRNPGELDALDNIWSFAAVMAGVESARTGHAVDVRKLIKM